MSPPPQRRLLVVPCLVLMVLGQATSSGAEPPPGSGDVLAGLSPAEVADLETMAEQDGISLEQAAHRYAWQDGFAMLATDLQERFPDDFAGAEIVDAAGHVAEIAFRDAVPAEARERAAAFGAAEVRLVGDRGHSVHELDDRVTAVHAAVTARQDLVDDVVSSYDSESGLVTVVVVPRIPADAGGPAPPDLVAELLAGVPAPVRTHVAAIHVAPGPELGQGEGGADGGWADVSWGEGGRGDGSSSGHDGEGLLGAVLPR